MAYFTDEDGDLTVRGGISIAGIIVAALFGIFLFFTSVYTVKSYEEALVFTWGAPSGTVSPGLHVKWSIAQKVVRINVQTRKVPVQSATYTKDKQTVTIASALNYSIDRKKAMDLYQNIGLDYEEKVIIPFVQSTIKNVITKYTSDQLIENRGSIEGEIEGLLKEGLNGRYLIVSEFNYENEDFDDAYEAAIRDKRVASELAEKAKFETLSAEQRKQQSILDAQAAAETSRLQAEALQTAGGQIVIEKIKAETMLEFAKAANNWDGKSWPQVLGGNVLDRFLTDFTK